MPESLWDLCCTHAHGERKGLTPNQVLVIAKTTSFSLFCLTKYDRVMSNLNDFTSKFRNLMSIKVGMGTI